MYEFDDETTGFAGKPTGPHECWAHAEKMEFPHRGYDYECAVCGEYLNSKKKMEDPGF